MNTNTPRTWYALLALARAHESVERDGDDLLDLVAVRSMRRAVGES